MFHYSPDIQRTDNGCFGLVFLIEYYRIVRSISA